MDTSTLTQTLRSLFPILKEEALTSLASFCAYKKVRKDSEIISIGAYHHYTYIILTGGAKSYYVKDGKEVCTWFAFEHEVIGSVANFQGLPSEESVIFLEESELIQIHIQKLKELAKQDLSTSQLLSGLLLEHALFTEQKLRYMQFMTAQERYEVLLDKEPSILQRVSLTDIASYLGVSRETLSRIRAMK